MRASKILSLSGLLFLCLAAPVFAQDCSPLQPAKPVDSEVANKTKANANVLLKSLGSGDFENEYSSIQNDVLSQYPHADRVHIWDSFVYMLCTMLQSSKSLTDEQKLDRYQGTRGQMAE